MMPIMDERIAITKHSLTIMYIDKLVMDLKLQLAGHKPGEPITWERLNEWAEYRRDLDSCRYDGGVR